MGLWERNAKIGIVYFPILNHVTVPVRTVCLFFVCLFKDVPVFLDIILLQHIVRLFYFLPSSR